MKALNKVNYKHNKVWKQKHYYINHEIIVFSKLKNKLQVPSHINISVECSCTSSISTPTLNPPKT